MTEHLIKFGTKYHRLDFLFSENYLHVCALGRFVTDELMIYDQLLKADDIKKLYDTLRNIGEVSVDHLKPEDKSLCVLKIKGKERDMWYCDEVNIYKRYNGDVIFSVFCGYRFHSHEFKLSSRQLTKLCKTIKKFYNLE